MSSGNDKGPRDRNSNGRISIPFAQEEDKPLAIVKETSKDTKLLEEENSPDNRMEIAKNVIDDIPFSAMPTSIHDNAVLEIEHQME